jgi:DEAD/DEAH box helicase domain-containing protein
MRELTPASRARAARRDVESIARALREDPELGSRFTAWHEEAARAPRLAPFPARLAPELVAELRRGGLSELYVHQARAIELALEGTGGRDVLVATRTASGKTLAYTLPVLQRLIESEGRARSLWLFPTKALSQDQSRAFQTWVERLGKPWHSFTYDGDTPPSVRRTLRDRGHVVLTNPWMLHQGILPNHGKWSELFQDLAYVVIDEVHTLSGVFGSSVANVLRRLVRIARHYGSEPRFLASSATVREPAEHARRLFGRAVEVVGEDGSGSGKRVFGVYDPPLVNPVAGLRANALEEVRRLAPRLVGPGHQTIFFCNRRTSVEVLTRYLKEGAAALGLEEGEIRGYRGGYLPNLRREIEAGLKDGSVKVVVSTNALELGIDIGSLDVACLVGYPGSQASFWQRAGRVGRRGRPSLTVLVARSDPIDQYLAHHPDFLFRAPREHLGIDPDNLVLLSEQLKCAAFELPFRTDAEGRVEGFGESPHLAGVLDYLAQESALLQKRSDGTRLHWHWVADAYPAQDVSLAGNEPDNVLVYDEEGKAIGEIDREGSITTVHEGAIYQVEGETYEVERFDYANRRAEARKVTSDYFTEAETDTEVRVLRLEEEAVHAGEDGSEAWCAWRGEVHVTTVATVFKKIRFYTRENVGAEDIVLPPEELDTEACVLTLTGELAAELGLSSAEGPAGENGDGAPSQCGGDGAPSQCGGDGAAWAGLGRLLRRVSPLFLRCQPSDLGLSTEIRSGHFERPAIYLYDRVPGSVGLGSALFRDHAEVLAAALDVLTGCECALGCPACIGPLEEVGARGKETALRVLGHLVERGGPAVLRPPATRTP